jgi:hypothetical protein
MNTGQMMLAVGAMILLSLVVLRVNNNYLSTDTVMMESKFGVLATSLAQSLIEEASGKAFDEHTKGVAILDSTLLTPPALLKNEGEVYPDYDDFDDYNGFQKDVTNLPSAIFHIECKVNYVNAETPDIVENHVTWNKKISVTVSSPSSKDTVKLYSIFSYWYF